MLENAILLENIKKAKKCNEHDNKFLWKFIAKHMKIHKRRQAMDLHAITKPLIELYLQPIHPIEYKPQTISCKRKKVLH